MVSLTTPWTYNARTSTRSRIIQTNYYLSWTSYCKVKVTVQSHLRRTAQRVGVLNLATETMTFYKQIHVCHAVVTYVTQHHTATKPLIQSVVHLIFVMGICPNVIQNEFYELRFLDLCGVVLDVRLFYTHTYIHTHFSFQQARCVDRTWSISSPLTSLRSIPVSKARVVPLSTSSVMAATMSACLTRASACSNATSTA